MDELNLEIEIAERFGRAILADKKIPVKMTEELESLFRMIQKTVKNHDLLLESQNKTSQRINGKRGRKASAAEVSLESSEDILAALK